MGDLNYDVSANTTGAIRSLDQLNSKVKVLGNTFSGLQRIIGGLAIGNFIRQTLAFADSIDDLAQATGIATSTILGFSQAVSQNGGNAESAQAAINKLVLSIGEAAEGGKAAQVAFAEVGVSLNDLQSLSEEDIFKKTIAGLARIEDVAKRSRLQNELLGKSLRGVNIQGAAAAFPGAAAGVNVSAIKAGADAYQNLATGVSNLRIATLEILEPFNRLVAGLNLNVETMKALIALITQLAYIFGLLKLAALAEQSIAAGRAVGLLGVAIKAFAVAMRLVTGPIGAFVTAIGLAIGATEFLMRLFYNRSVVKEWFEPAIEYAKELALQMGLIKPPAPPSQPLVIQGQGAQAAPQGFKSLQEYFRVERLNKITREVEDAFAKQSRAIRQTVKDYDRLTAEQIANINISRISLNMSEDEIAVQDAVTEVIRRNEDAIRNLIQQKQNLSKEDQRLIGVIDGQIAALRNRLEADTANTAEAVRNLNAVRIEQEKLRLELETTNQLYRDNAALQAIQDQIALIGLYGEELENNRIALEVTQELQGKLLDLQERLADLENRRKQIGEERYQNELDNINKLIQRAYEYAGVRIELEQQVLDAQKAAQQDWMGAINAQIEDLAKQFTPVQLATDLFKSAINGIDNALTDFIQKGKFNFKDFASSILRDMALIIARALIMRAILSVLGIFSPTAAASLSSMVGIPGRAKGGPVGSNKMYMVGEEGPELFVPRTAGNIIPNNQMAMATAQSAPQVTYNINATDAQSFRALIARDPSFIYNVTEVGRRSSPARRLA